MITSEHSGYIVQEYKAGRSSTDLAKEMGCSSALICKILRQNKVEIRLKMLSRKEITILEPSMVEMYSQGLGLEEIGTKFSISPMTVRSRLNKLGVNTSKPTNINEIMKHSDDIIRMYEECGNSAIIGERFDCSGATILRVLQKNGIETKKRKLYSCNENIFEKVDTEQVAWVVGILFADGHVVTNEPIMKIQLNDRETIEKIRTIIEYTGPIYEILHDNPNHNTGYAISVYNKKLKSDLEKLGVVEQKSLILKYPTILQIPENLRRHFIRGYLDGDGSIHSFQECFSEDDPFAKWATTFIGTEEVMNGIISDIKNNVPVEYFSLYKHNKKNKSNTYQLAFAGKGCIPVLNWLYKDSTIYMERKYRMYINLVQYYDFKSGKNKTFSFYKIAKRTIKTLNSISGMLESKTEEIINLYQSGKSAVKISEKFGVTVSHITYILKRNRVMTKSNCLNTNYIDTLVEDMAKLYKSGLTLRAIGEKFGVSDKTIANRLNKVGIDTSKGKSLEEVEENLEEIIKLYEKTQSSVLVAEQFGTSGGTIIRILDKHNIKHKIRQKYTVDTNYFDSIDSEHKAYTFGAFFGTGNIKSGTLITIFGAKNKDFVQLIKDQIEYTGPIEEDRDYFRIKISGKEMRNSLLPIFGEGKSNGLKFPELPENLIRHFIRGYFESRGRIDLVEGASSRWVVSFPGDTNIFEYVSKLFIDNGLCEKLDKYKNYGKSQLQWLDYLYQGSNLYRQDFYSKYLEMTQFYKKS